MQPQGHLQMMVNTLDYGMNPQASLDAPRWRFASGHQVGSRSRPTRGWSRACERSGTTSGLQPATALYGRGQIIWRLPGGGYVAGSDKRADGAAVGY